MFTSFLILVFFFTIFAFGSLPGWHHGWNIHTIVSASVLPCSGNTTIQIASSDEWFLQSCCPPSIYLTPAVEMHL